MGFKHLSIHYVTFGLTFCFCWHLVVVVQSGIVEYNGLSFNATRRKNVYIQGKNNLRS